MIKRRMMKRSMLLSLLAGLALAPNAFGFLVEGNVYCDVNGDGGITSGDIPLPGLTIRAVQGLQVGTGITDAAGAYIVGGIGTGNWIVSVDPASLNPGATATSLAVLLTNENPFQSGLDLLVDDPACREVVPYCGDGTLDAGEACDDGNNVDGDGCSANCTVEAYCGDGTLDPGEQCDDGNNENGDGCSALCATEGGGEGCTPGYWKQSQHFDSYAAPYAPTTLFVDAFGVDAFPGKTLVQVLGTGGGGLNALGRHAVAALLNAASGGVDYDRTTAEVIASFGAAHASGSYEALKNVFSTFNEQGCPLN